MNLEDVVKAYYQFLTHRKVEEIPKLFTSDALVSSPLYGKLTPSAMYERLFSDTKELRVMIKNFFFSRENPRVVATHLHFDCTLRNGVSIEAIESVNIFEFSQNDLIHHLRILYDTNKTRPAFENL